MVDKIDKAEPDEERQDEYDENEDQDEIAERRPVILQEHTHLTDPVLAQARVSMQVLDYPNAPSARCIAARAEILTYMAYIVVHWMHKSRPANTKWTSSKREHMDAMFQKRNRYDLFEQWPTLNEIDVETQISRLTRAVSMIAKTPMETTCSGNSESVNCSALEAHEGC